MFFTRRFKQLLFSVLLCSSIFFTACSNPEGSIDLTNQFEYAVTSRFSNINNAMYLNYKPLPYAGRRNLSTLAPQGGYVWVRTKFRIPDHLKGQELGLFASYIHFADQLYINGVFAGSYGSFPPKEWSAGYAGQFFNLPHQVLHQNEDNWVYLKIYTIGKSEMSRQVFVDTAFNAKGYERWYTLYHSSIYIVFEGGLFCAMLIYFILALREKNNGEYILFSLTCLFSMLFLAAFFMPVTESLIKWFTRTYLTEVKVVLCFGIYSIIFAISGFLFRYIDVPVSKLHMSVRIAIWLIPTIITFCMPDYQSLMKITPYMLIATFIQLADVAEGFFLASKTAEHRNAVIQLAFGTSPVIFSMAIDIFVKGIFHNSNMPFFTVYGWQISVIIYLITLTLRYSKVNRENEFLSINLQKEIKDQTHELSITNEMLSDEIAKSKIDLQMAAIVQQKFFPHPNRSFMGWDIAICYEPLAEVSGDLYDYYNIGNILDGFCLFDVSGHGIAASLITMLSKNIISQSFTESRFEDRSKTPSQILMEINRKILNTKGNVDNYLTGLLFKVSEFDSNDTCRLTYSNAGHPHPVLYVDRDDDVIELQPDKERKQFGAIGIKGIEVFFQDLSFSMSTGDVLVMFTDGLTEATDFNKVQFGKENVQRVVKANHYKDAAGILKALQDELNAHIKNKARDDDLTIMVFKRQSSSNFAESLNDLEELEELTDED